MPEVIREDPDPQPAPLPTLRAATGDLERAARSLVGRWWLVLVTTASFVVVSAVLVASVVQLERWLYLPVVLMLAGAAVYNVGRFLPKAPIDDEPDVRLRPEDEVSLRRVLGSNSHGWSPDSIRLTSHPHVHIDGAGVMHVGLPLLACLGPDDLVGLTEEALVRRGVLYQGVVGRARRLAEGQLGRGFRDPRSGPVGRRLVDLLDDGCLHFVDALHGWGEAMRRHREQDWAPSLHAAGVVTEATQIVAAQWLSEAWEEGWLHREPISGVRAFLDGAAREGLLEDASFELIDLPLIGIGHYEQEFLVATASAGKRLVEWDEHAGQVAVPRWQRELSTTLVAIEHTVGSPRPATLGSLLDVLEAGAGRALALRYLDLMSGPRLDVERPDAEPVDEWSILHDPLVAALALTVLEVPGARALWSWPFGSEVVGPGGDAVPLGAAATAAIEELRATGRCPRFRAWLEDAGLDPAALLWVGDGAAPEERPLVAYTVYLSLTRRVLHVVTDRAVHVLDQGWAERMGMDLDAYRSGAASALQPVMDDVAAGRADGESELIPVREVVQAQLMPLLGGMYWSLVLRTGRTRHRVLGVGGVPDVVVDGLRAVLGDRLSTRGLEVSAWVRTTRFYLVAVCVGLGFLVLPVGPLLAVQGDATVGEALVISAVGPLLLLVAVAPDLVRWRLGSRKARRQLALDQSLDWR